MYQYSQMYAYVICMGICVSLVLHKTSGHSKKFQALEHFKWRWNYLALKKIGRIPLENSLGQFIFPRRCEIFGGIFCFFYGNLWVYYFFLLWSQFWPIMSFLRKISFLLVSKLICIKLNKVCLTIFYLYLLPNCHDCSV